jgi:hypothetical protein
MSSDGSVASVGQGDTLGKAMAAKPAAAAPSSQVGREGGVVRKQQFQEDGSSTVVYTRREAMAPTPVALDPLDRATLNGSKVPRARLTEEAMVSHPRLDGDMPIKNAIDLGWIKKTADSGFAWAGEMADIADPAPSGKFPRQDGKEGPQQEEAVSLSGVEGTPPMIDVTKSMLTKQAGPQVANGLTAAYIAGTDPTSFVDEIARKTGQDPKEVREATDAVAAAYTKSARQVAMANGLGSNPGAWETFVAWASDKQPQAAQEAFLNFVNKHDASGIGRLARQYSRSGAGKVQYSDAEILGATFGDGITAVRTIEHGVVLNIPGHPQMSLRAAVERGLVQLG